MRFRQIIVKFMPHLKVAVFIVSWYAYNVGSAPFIHIFTQNGDATHSPLFAKGEV